MGYNSGVATGFLEKVNVTWPQSNKMARSANGTVARLQHPQSHPPTVSIIYISIDIKGERGLNL